MLLERILHLALQAVSLLVRLCVAQLLTRSHPLRRHEPNLHHLHQHFHWHLVVVVFAENVLSRYQLHLLVRIRTARITR